MFWLDPPAAGRRPAASLPASFTPTLLNNALRFASLVTSSREDFHLQVDAHAGRTKRKDRLAAVSLESYWVFYLGGCNGNSGTLTLPAPTEQAHRTEASGKERECRRKWRGSAYVCPR
jgi:hypothetical protein